MATLAISGLGTELRLGDGDSIETFTAIAEVTTIGVGGMSRETIDVTSLDSTGGFREYILSFKDVGEITFTCNFTGAGWTDFYDLWSSGALSNYQLALPDDVLVLNFAAYVVSVPFENIVPDSQIAISVTLQVSGEISVDS